MGAMSWQHWLIVAVVVIVLFGSKKLPDAARGLGRSLRIFKSEVKEMQNDGTPAPEQAPAAQLPATPQVQQPAVAETVTETKAS